MALRNIAASRKKRITLGIILIIGAVLVSFILFTLFSNTHTKKTAETPTYETILPKNKAIQDLGGWHRVSPPDTAAVYAYEDEIDGVPVSVSEQSLPADFKSNPNADVADIAKNFNATTKIATNSIEAYIGTSASGPQSVIFTKNKVLILIKSERKIENKSWLRYIDLLN